MTETTTHETAAYTAVQDAPIDFLYDGSEEWILFIIEPDGTHTIPKRDTDRMVEVYPYPRRWPDISDEHRTARVSSLEEFRGRYPYTPTKLPALMRPKPPLYNGDEPKQYILRADLEALLKAEREAKRPRRTATRFEPKITRTSGSRPGGTLESNREWRAWVAYWSEWKRLIDGWKDIVRAWWAVLAGSNYSGQDIAVSLFKGLTYKSPLAVERDFCFRAIEYFEDCYASEAPPDEPLSDEGWRKIAVDVLSYMEYLLPSLYLERGDEIPSVTYLNRMMRVQGDLRAAMNRQHGEKPSMLTLNLKDSTARAAEELGEIANPRDFVGLTRDSAEGAIRNPGRTLQAKFDAGDISVAELLPMRHRTEEAKRTPAFKSLNWTAEDGDEFGDYLPDEDDPTEREAPADIAEDTGLDPAIRYSNSRRREAVRAIASEARKVAARDLTAKQLEVFKAISADGFTRADKDIAADLGMSESAFNRVKRRALGRVKAALEAQGITEDTPREIAQWWISGPPVAETGTAFRATRMPSFWTDSPAKEKVSKKVV
jgi:DNA-directed RNA polymerase specialized sigma24 family protein